MCFLIGNDFIPHILMIDIKLDGIVYLIEKYCEVFIEFNNYLVDTETKTINHLFFKLFLSKLAENEDDILTKNFSKTKKFYFQGDQNDLYAKELFKIENLLIKIDDPVGVGINPNYRNNYYKHYFDVEDDLEEFVEKIVYEYLVGIRWITYYYFDKIPDWNWYYPYSVPPFISDISKYFVDINDIKFTEGKPLTPFEQLLTILPPKANYLLPDSLVKLMINPKSSLAHLYPISFQLDYLNKNKYWKCTPILPELEIKLIKHAFKKYKDEIDEKDIKRNLLDVEIIF
jgi:5'-3' exonuclease